MLSLKYIRENTDFVQESLIRKQSKCNITSLLELDNQRRKYLQEVEQFRAEKNKVSNLISKLKSYSFSTIVFVNFLNRVTDFLGF